MSQVFGYSPTTTETNYATITGADVALVKAGFVDSGARTTPNNRIIYSGVVADPPPVQPNDPFIVPGAPAPDATMIGVISRSVEHIQSVPSSWGVAEMKAWALQHPGAIIYAAWK